MNTRSRRDFLKAAGAAAAALAGCRRPLAAARPARRPNIVFILADDMGWMDSTAYGSRYYDTPNIARLARRGMLFTDAYAANPLCSPTRASILTGKYPARLGITTPACHLPPPAEFHPYPKSGPPSQPLLVPQSRRFLPLGEVTIAEALRQAGYHTAFMGKWHLGAPSKFWPKAQGFDVDLGAPNPGPPSYFSPYRLKNFPDGPKGKYVTDDLTDRALDYIEAHRDKPFFLCLWHFSVHAPFQAKPHYIERYRPRKDPLGRQDCPTMAAMLKSLDDSVGRVLDKLDELGIADETLLVFFSDNGGNMYSRVDDTTPTNNAPLRGGKATIYEGGTRVPLVVAWPGVVRPGSRCSTVVTSVDFYPTLLEVAGVPPPKGQVLDGESIRPLLDGSGRLRREAIFCHFPHRVPATGAVPSAYVRKGRWKLIRLFNAGPKLEHRYELYDLEADIGETKNLADAMPEKVRELDALLEKFIKDTGALVPIPNPAYDPATKLAPGWRTSRQCRFTVKDGAMRIESTGGDPFVHTADVPAAKGPLVVRFRMRSSSRGIGQFFWTTARQPRFGRNQRLIFKPAHDGQWHDCEVRFTAGAPLRAIRLDPSTAPGIIEIDWLRLARPDGTVLKSWDFAPPKP